MKTLIIPMAGKSTRFPNMKPKWMLTHPFSNHFMAIESLSGINLDFFDQVIFACLRSHEEQFGFLDGFSKEFKTLYPDTPFSIHFLNAPTQSQSETVYKAIIDKNICDFIFIKDSDSYYEANIEDVCNQVSFFDLNDIDMVNARSKSYLLFDQDQLIYNIIEKKVISSFFSVGGYGFASAKDFCLAYEKIKDLHAECYISDVIYSMILYGQRFKGLKTDNFKDWGTLEDWDLYKKTYKCLFIDIDGTIFSHTSSHFTKDQCSPLQNNIDFLNKLYSSKKVKIILTTSREKHRMEETIRELEQFKVPYDDIVMGLPHCQRIIINDFADSNPYPSCDAINIPRNNDSLEKYFK